MIAIYEKVRAAGKISDLRRGQIDSHVVIKRGEDFLEMDRAIDGLAAEAIGAADDLAGLHIAAGHQCA